jgi:hypothetical protein
MHAFHVALDSSRQAKSLCRADVAAETNRPFEGTTSIPIHLETLRGPETSHSLSLGASDSASNFALRDSTGVCWLNGPITPKQPGEGAAHKRRPIRSRQIAMSDHHLLDWPGENFVECDSRRATIEEARTPITWHAGVGAAIPPNRVTTPRQPLDQSRGKFWIRSANRAVSLPR